MVKPSLKTFTVIPMAARRLDNIASAKELLALFAAFNQFTHADGTHGIGLISLLDSLLDTRCNRFNDKRRCVQRSRIVFIIIAFGNKRWL